MEIHRIDLSVLGRPEDMSDIRIKIQPVA